VTGEDSAVWTGDVADHTVGPERNAWPIVTALELLAEISIHQTERGGVVSMIDRDVSDDSCRSGEPFGVARVELVFHVRLKERERYIVDVSVGDVDARFHVGNDAKHDAWRVGLESSTIVWPRNL